MATGATGTAPATVYGSFYSFNTGPFTPPNATGAATVVIPTETASSAPYNTAGAFTVNPNGSITMNVAGCYLVIATINLQANNQGVFGIIVNNDSLTTPYLQSFGNNLSSTTGSTQLNHTSIICVNAGDIVNIGLVESATSLVSLVNPDSSTIVVTPASTLTFALLQEA